MNYLAANRDKKYVKHGWVGQTWAENLYERGILPRRQLQNLWQFNREAIRIAEALGRGSGTSTLAEALIKVLMQLDLVFEHSGLLGDESSGPSQEYYLVPEVWSQRHNDRSRREMSMDAQTLPLTYNLRTHAMIGWQMDVQGWLLPSFFRKFVCKCATALTKMSNVWSGGRVALGRDTLRWESAAWPNKEKASALWLERGEQDSVTVKVAGLKGERYLMRALSLEVVRLLQVSVKWERIAIVGWRVGTLPPGCGAADDLVWINHAEAKRRLQSGERIMELYHNGETVDLPLYLFDQRASACDMIPNFDPMQRISRQAHDPDFLLHCRNIGNPDTAGLAHFRQALGIAGKVIAASWGAELTGRLLNEWKAVLNRAEIKKLIQVVDVTGYGVRGDMSHVDYHLFVCLPYRNLYVPAERYHNKVLHEFCEEVLRMFKVLRAKKATITIQSSEKRNRETSGVLGFLKWGGSEDPSQMEYDLTENLPLSREWDPPTGDLGGLYPLDTETWYYLDEMNAHCRTKFRGLDLTGARDSILRIKHDRIEGGTTIGSAKFKLLYSKSDEFELSGSYQGFAAQWRRSNKMETTLEMEYEAEAYNWNEENQAWE